ATWGDRTAGDILPPSSAPLPEWAEEEPAPVYDVVEYPDDRVPAARALISLYRSVLASEEQFGDLTGRYSALLAVKRELEIMISQLAHLIADIEHPEEEPPAAD